MQKGLFEKFLNAFTGNKKLCSIIQVENLISKSCHIINVFECIKYVLLFYSDFFFSERKKKERKTEITFTYDVCVCVYRKKCILQGVHVCEVFLQ